MYKIKLYYDFEISEFEEQYETKEEAHNAIRNHWNRMLKFTKPNWEKTENIIIPQDDKTHLDQIIFKNNEILRTVLYKKDQYATQIEWHIFADNESRKRTREIKREYNCKHRDYKPYAKRLFEIRTLQYIAHDEKNYRAYQDNIPTKEKNITSYIKNYYEKIQQWRPHTIEWEEVFPDVLMPNILIE